MKIPFCHGLQAGRFFPSTVFLLGLPLLGQPVGAANITWIGGNTAWTDGTGNNANWSPADEPDTDDTAIFNTANTANLGANNSVLALTLSGGIDLTTDGFNLDVNGLVQLSAASTNLVLSAPSVVTADSVTINNGGSLRPEGGTLRINEESGDGLLDLNAGGILSGFGLVTMTDAVAATTTLIINDGTISARRDPLVILGPPQAGTLSLSASDVDARIDLDGAGELGAVTVLRNQTLEIGLPLADIFNGSIAMRQNTTLDISTGWTLGATGAVDIDNGAIVSFPGVPAGTATIAGGALSQNSGTLTVLDPDGTLQFDAPYFLNSGTFSNSGHVIFNANSQLAAAGTFVPVAGSKVTVGANRTLLIAQTNINLDGDNSVPVEYTVNQGGSLNLTSTDYDSDVVTNSFEGAITLNGGTFNSTTGDPSFVMNGTLNMANTGGTAPNWDGEAIMIGNDSLALDAHLNVIGTGIVDFSENVTFLSDADVEVADGAVLRFLSASNVTFNPVNGSNNAQFTGAGEMAFHGTVNFNETTTLNMPGGIIDFDGLDPTGNLINIDAPVTINVEQFRSFGKANDVMDINNSAGTGVLTVNLDNPAGQWALSAQGVLNLVNDNTDATLLAGSDVNLNGTVNVTGDVRTVARVDMGATAAVVIGTAAQPLRLGGGNETTAPNTIAGGTINGAGILGADTGRALHGFGLINTQIDFDGSADLMADNGTLTIDGTKLVDVNTLGTVDADGVLNVTGNWNNNVTMGIQLRGGTLNGGTITNDTTAGISGHGLVTARVINNTQLFASIGDKLILQTAGNDNDWDGTTNTGEIEAVSADIEIRDTGAAFGFAGTVRAANGHTAFANGFALDFNPGSTLILASGGKYHATGSTDLGGTVAVGPGGAVLQVENNRFLSFEAGSTTTLGSNLQLLNNNIIIEQGAGFNGSGALVVPDGSHLVVENLANIGVLLNQQGALRPGNSEGIARVDLLGYQMGPDSQLFTELRGTALNAYDRLVVDGTAVVDGILNIDIDDVSPGVPFVPVAGNTFNIITAGSVTGKFKGITYFGMPPGVVFDVVYLSNAVQLQAVAGSFYDIWISKFPGLSPAQRLKTADPDGDGLNNLAEFGLNGDPTQRDGSKLVTKIAPVAGEPVLTFTFPLRFLSVADPVDPASGKLVMIQVDDSMRYHIEATDGLAAFPVTVSEVTGSDAAAIQAGLPPPDPGWFYHTFRSEGAVAANPRRFMRVSVTE